MPKTTKISNIKKVRNYDLENFVAVDINSNSKEIEPAIEMSDNGASSSTIGDKAINSDSRDIEPAIEMCDNDASSFTIEDKPGISKEERKARKLIAKLGLERIHGVKQVTMKGKTKQMFAINYPDVYKHPATDNYIVFGEPLVEDNIQRAQIAAAKKIKYARMQLNMFKRYATNTRSIAQEDEEKNEEEDKRETDYKGVNEKYVNLVCEQTKVNKHEAIEALLKNDNDLVNTIMYLTI